MTNGRPSTGTSLTLGRTRLVPSLNPICLNNLRTCARGTEGNSRYHPGIPAHGATSDKSHAQFLPQLPPPWQLDQSAYQEFGLGLSRFLLYDRGNAGATEWQGAFA